MAREVQIVTWCDYCLAQDESVEGASYNGLNSEGGQVTIDLCEDHMTEVLAPALDVFDTYGRVEPKRRTTRKPKPTTRNVDTDIEPCPECGKEFHSAQSIGMHRWRKHGVPSKHRREKADA